MASKTSWKRSIERPKKMKKRKKPATTQRSSRLSRRRATLSHDGASSLTITSRCLWGQSKPLAESPNPYVLHASAEISHILITNTQVYKRIRAKCDTVVKELSSALRRGSCGVHAVRNVECSEPTHCGHKMANACVRPRSRPVCHAHRRSGLKRRLSPKKVMLTKSATTTRA
eukprot:764234-Prymnesium_polylepis.2